MFNSGNKKALTKLAGIKGFQLSHKECNDEQYGTTETTSQILRC